MKAQPWIVRAVTLIFVASAAIGQAPEARLRERVDVSVREILVIPTDAKLSPYRTPVRPSDLEVIEDGARVEILAVDPLSAAASARMPAGVSSSPPPAPLSQVLYVDASLLENQSVKRLAKVLLANLPQILARGPLSIVVADPSVREFLGSTVDSASVKASLEEMPKRVHGRQRIHDIRSELFERPPASGLEHPGKSSAFVQEGVQRTRFAVEEELQILKQSFQRLDEWAGEHPSPAPAILYFANDGFDANLAEAYAAFLRRGGHDADALSSDFSSNVPPLVAHLSDRLSTSGYTTIALAIGGLQAAQIDIMKRSQGIHESLNEDTPIFLFARPLESLRLIADATGGELLTREDRFGQVLDRLGGAVLVSYRSAHPSDGRVHKLEVRSAREGLVVRAARSVVSGTSQSASAAAATRALGGSEAAGELPVSLNVEFGAMKKNFRRTGVMHISVEMGGISAVLKRVGPGRARVTFAVEVGEGSPFIQHAEVDLPPMEAQSVWLFDAPLEWPPEAKRLAVTVEELKTGVSGSSAADLPNSSQ